jgi:predicted deacylase
LKQKTITLFDFVEGHAVQVSRILASIQGKPGGPNIVFIGGMHGNEPTGVLALKHTMRQLERLQPLMHGNVYALVGNLNALERGERYIQSDLNRIWQADNVERARRKDYHPTEIINEVEEQIELWGIIDELMQNANGPFYFVDLHTTSVKSVPFVTMSDTVMNRRFARKLPVPLVIGIEEYLSEPLLSYVNELGCVSIAFEGGQHSDAASVRNHEALIWLCLAQAGVMRKLEIPGYKAHRANLFHESGHNKQVYEVRHRQGIEPGSLFQMLPGFVNFQSIKRDQPLAKLDGQIIHAHEDGLIFMPLYQAQGSDGFFTIRRIKPFWLTVSYIFRRLSLYRILRFLPGVRPFMNSDQTMVVNTAVAKWYSTEILHLMGFRRKKQQGELVLFMRRKYDFKGPKHKASAN